MTNTPPPVHDKVGIGIKRIVVSDEVSYSYQIELINQIRYLGVKVIDDPENLNRVKKTKKIRFVSTAVQLGRLAVVTRGNAAYDHDGFAEVYLPGEMIIKRNLEETNEWRIVEIASNPGFIEVFFIKQIPSNDENIAETLKAIFTYYIYVEDPIKLLSQHSNWDAVNGNDYIVNRIEELVTDTIKNYVQGDIQVWSAEDINQVADNLKIYLDSKLKVWGLRMRPDFIAVREIPESIYALIFSCIRAENTLAEESAAQYRSVGLSNEAIVKIQTDSRNNNDGLGLFNFISNKVNNNQKLVEYFRSNREFLPIVQYIEILISQNNDERQIALINQIIRKKFLNPNICNGEWLELSSKLE